MKATVIQLKNSIADAKLRHSEALEEVISIEKDISDFNVNKDDKLAELQATVEKLKKTQIKTSVAVKNLLKELQAVRMDTEQTAIDLSAVREQLVDVNLALGSQETDLLNLQEEQRLAKGAHEEAESHLTAERAKLTGFDDELRSLEDMTHSKSSRIAEEGLEIQKLSHAVEKSQKEQLAAKQTLVQTESEHDWIADEKEAFGCPNTAYDFNSHNIAESKSSLKNVTERFQGMKKKINPKVMNMIDSVEKKEASLKNMMKTVIRDKRKIEETITSLDEYKKEALHKTWEKVNGDFGAIFAELLPGSFAKLDPPEGKTIGDGLEVKVCLGKVWKQSLTELSGGQRFVNTDCDRLSYPATDKGSQVPDRPFSYPRPLTIQTCTHVHS